MMFLIHIAIAYAAALLIDGTWLRLTAPLYLPAYKTFMSFDAIGNPELNLTAGLLAWFFIVLGNYVFVTPMTDFVWWKSIVWGFCFGVVIYGVYNTTNMAVFTQWSVLVAIIDTFWGGIFNVLIALVILLAQKYW